MFIPGMLFMSCVFGGCFLFRPRVLGLRDAPRRFTFALAFDVALGLFMPGMLWLSCCENATGPVANEIKIKLAKNKYLYFEKTLLMTTFLALAVRTLSENYRKNVRTLLRF